MRSPTAAGVDFPLFLARIISKGGAMTGKGETMTEALRRVIADSGMAHISIARETGVQRMSIVRFLNGTQSLRLDAADKLAAYFGLEVIQRKQKGK
jgi:DNA-binding phage protein